MNQKRMVIVTAIVLALVLTLALVGYFYITRHSSRTYEEKVAAFTKENPSLFKGQIVFIGDSITEHYPLDRHYRSLDLKVYNRGISGDTVSWMKMRLGESLFALSPSKVVLMIGTNDINYGKSTEEIAIEYESVLQMMQKSLPDASIFCVSIIPQNTEYSPDANLANRRILEINEKIKALVASYGMTYVDLYASLVDEDGLLARRYSSDGLHLNARGYRIWTDVMKDLLA